MYLRLRTNESNFKVINKALFDTANILPKIFHNNQAFYRINFLSTETLKLIGWILDYYNDTEIDVLESLNTGGVNNDNEGNT